MSSRFIIGIKVQTPSLMLNMGMFLFVHVCEFLYRLFNPESINVVVMSMKNPHWISDYSESGT